MITDPRTGRPVESKEALAKERRRFRVVAERGKRLETDLATAMGSEHLADLLADFQHAINSLSLEMTLDQMQATVSKIIYIRDRMISWGVKINMGRVCAEKLSKAVLGPGIEGSAQ